MATQPVLNVVLVEPEIPQNTGNIARLCAATNTVLHLVHPLGFSIDDKNLKRAGLDYWPYVKVIHHVDIQSYLRVMGENYLFFSAKGDKTYNVAPYCDGCHLIFGKESVGLSREIIEKYRDKTYRIPIWGHVRSLNLATSVGIVLYEAYRQLGGF